MIACCTMQVCFGQKIRFTDTSNKWTDVLYGGLDPYSSRKETTAYSSDTIIAHQHYHRLIGLSSSPMNLAVREDTAAGIIYCRFLMAQYFDFRTDTFEHIFFDYRLKVGDTFRVSYGTRTVLERVQALDSVMLDGMFYKRWSMKPQGGFTASYIFIEGLGPLTMPTFSISNQVFEHEWQLRCFYNKGRQPVLSPHQYLGANSYFQPESGVMLVDTFDNATSCMFRPATVSTPYAQTTHILAPNPATGPLLLTLSANIHAATFQILDVTGRVVYQQAITEQKTLMAQYLTTPGVYFYTLQDAATGGRYTGRFVFAP